MNCHQILSGACNSGDHCFAVGSVEGIPFTAYAAGCNIVILASTFERVQIIPGAWHNYIRISCLDCSTDTGKIAAAYENQVCIYEPTPLILNNSSHQLDYRWVQTGTLQIESHITSLSWNLEGTRLLTGGQELQLWHQHVGLVEELETGTLLEEDRGWECIWKCHTATPVVHMAFSPDGTLFATSGKSDRLVKIWFENKQLLFPSKSVDHPMSYGGQSTFNEINYGFVYVAHPRAVTNLSWRKTSKYMPKGAVSNMLVTSCRDNICRVWVETVLPDDGLVNMSQFDPLASQNPKFRTHRHKHRFMQRLKHMKTCFHIRRHAKNTQVSGAIGGLMGIPLGSPIPTLPSTYSVHDFHSYGYHGTGVTPGLHFHLAASINAETGRSAEDEENGVQILVRFNEDIPLVPSLLTGDPEKEPNFILHWLNNKEMHFSQQAENILHELTKKVVEKEEGLEGQHNAYLHESEHDDHSPRKQQRSGKLGKTLSTDESSEEHHPSFPSSGPHSHQSLRPCGNHSCCHLLLPYLSRSPLRYFLYVVHLFSSSSVGTNLRQTANLDTKISSSSATTSINSLATDSGPVHIPDSLDAKIEGLLRDWHHNPDLLFSIHPIDGSYLIWVVEFLDEYHPGSFRQAQVSFSTRIPNAFPLGDAMTMSTNGPVSATAGGNNEENGEPLPSVLEEDTEAAGTDNQEDESNDTKTSNQNGSGSSVGVDSGTGGNLSDIVSGDPSPAISMVSKHSNGTLNLWQLTFGDHSKFSQVLSIGHSSRASGHRFRVNDITCHPVLPLLLTTSHHNITDVPGTPVTINPHNKDDNYSTFTGFCSELILWRVDAVGPLSKSGGVSELARINSPEISAFSNVAWIPTLLPSTTLGNLSNSPSACFVASDGKSLRVYQAVIDARTLLAEISSSERRSRMLDSMFSVSSLSSLEDGVRFSSLQDMIKIVSQQSTARPGCVIQLDAISDATHDWQNTQFLHVFQEQLITGERAEEKTVNPDLGFMESQLAAMVDLQQTSVFEEPFYIVVLERTNKGTVVHMWRLVIASQPDNAELTGSMMYVPDSHLIQDEDDGEERHGRSASMSAWDQLGEHVLPVQASHMVISTTKVCTQDLPLPDGVEVVHAAPAAGHLSSASIYPACFAPYIVVTACSDSTIRYTSVMLHSFCKGNQRHHSCFSGQIVLRH
uniref:DmX-like protein 2 n=1 Tax=Timema cristinae TaxID=61476 RepID=A0A7R9H351_TIMCR|nr:unnamed protein product [Timema cristinae]